MNPYDPSDNYFKNFTKGRSGPKTNPFTNPNLRILGEDRFNQIKRMGPTILKEGAKKAAAGPFGPVGAFTTGLAIGDALNAVTGAVTGKDISERIADKVYEVSGMQAQEEKMNTPLVRPLDPKTGYPTGYEAPTMSAMTPEEFEIAKQNQVPAIQTEPQSTLRTDTAFMGTPTYGSTQGRPIDAIANVFRDPSFEENTSMTERGVSVGTENILKGIQNMAIDLLQESTGTNILQDFRKDPSVSKERERELQKNPEELQPGEFVPTADEGVTDISQFLQAKGREMPVIDETSPEFTLRSGRNMPIIGEEKFDGSSEVKPSTSRAVETGTFQALDPQGRLRQFQAPGVLAEQYAPFERESAAREARLEARGPMVGGPETAVRSGDALGGQISLNEARKIVDPQGKMSTPARTAAAQEYIRQEEIKIQDRARKDIDRQNEERMNELRIEGQRLQNVIRQKQLDDPKFDENVYSRDLTQKVADIAEKFRENPSYEPSADERKTIFEYDAYRVGKLGASGIAYSPFLDQFGAPEFTEKQEADIKKVMDGNNISREKAISAMKAAGKL